MKIIAGLGSLIIVGVTAAHAQSPQAVTVDNFVRAESDLYFGGIVKDSGGALGKFSSALFDLEAGPVTITLPDAGKCFRSMQLISQDHYVRWWSTTRARTR